MTNFTVTLDGQGNEITNYYRTNGVTHLGTTTISNGVLALVAPCNLNSNTASITLAGTGAVLDLSAAGYSPDGTNVVTDSTLTVALDGLGLPQTLAGFGTIRGSVVASSGSTVSVGLPTGTLTVTGSVSLAGAVGMNLDTASTPNCSQLAAASFVIGGSATLTVANIGPALQGGEAFQLFNHPVSFSSVTLPSISSPLSWTNKLAVDGSIAVLGSLVNTNPVPITFANVGGTNLTLSWPSDHLGWRLQGQTNTLNAGISTNWVTVPGSTTVTQMSFTVTRTHPSVFFRLVYP